MSKTKLPQVGEYWRNRGGEIAFIACDSRAICGEVKTIYPLIAFLKNGVFISLTHDGCEYGEKSPTSDDLVEHLPLCTGFEWKPEPAIDPGEGYRLLEDDEKPEATDDRAYMGCPEGEAWDPITRMKGWCNAKTVGDLRIMYHSWNGVVIRRKLTESARYYTCDTWEKHAYAKRVGITLTFVSKTGGDDVSREWHGVDAIAMSLGILREITEVEALALVKPAEIWPKYFVPISKTPTTGDGRVVAYYVLFEAGDGETFCTDGSKFSWPVCGFVACASPVSEAEAKARINPKQEQPSVKRVPVRLCVEKHALTSSNRHYICAVPRDGIQDTHTEVFSDGEGGWEVRVPE